MLSSEILHFFSKFTHLQKFFYGIFSSDLQPHFLKINYFMICNTSPSTSDSGHWYVIFRPSSDTIEYFDSLGVDQSKANKLKDHLKIRNLKEIEYNETPVQSSSSTTCGHFCLFFILERLHNLDYSFDQLVNEIFSDNISLNERVVTEFYKEYQDGNFNQSTSRGSTNPT